ncbi:MAG: VanZ family protein [Candidatus Acidiferrum sp.]
MPPIEARRDPRPAPDPDDVRQHTPPSSTIPSWLRAWWAALLWSAIIFLASTDSFSKEHTSLIVEPILRWLFPSITHHRVEVIHFFIRKSAHFTEYFIFFLLLYRGIRRNRRGWHWSWAFAAWFVAAAYSALDEIHQSFVASRTASPWDSLLDSAGAIFALLVLFFLYRFLPRLARA